jgi:hypothetical protein
MPKDEKAEKTPPKAGRRGGASFPRLALREALEYSDKIVRKTHTGPLPASAILAGVFGNSGPLGVVRASALKKYGLLEGPTAGYTASVLAKTISAAPIEEQRPHIRTAFLNPKVFKQIFEAFQGDTVSKAKIKQHATSLNVHPDSAEECAEFFIESAAAAGEGRREGDSITLGSASPTAVAEGGEEIMFGQTGSRGDGVSEGGGSPVRPASAVDKDNVGSQEQHSNKAGVTVNLTVDSSLDTEKLQKQLELLRRFGVI